MIKQLANLSIIEHENGQIQAVITSCPNGNPIEDMLKSTLDLINTLIKQAQTENNAQNDAPEQSGTMAPPDAGDLVASAEVLT